MNNQNLNTQKNVDFEGTIKETIKQSLPKIDLDRKHELKQKLLDQHRANILPKEGKLKIILNKYVYASAFGALSMALIGGIVFVGVLLVRDNSSRTIETIASGPDTTTSPVETVGATIKSIMGTAEYLSLGETQWEPITDEMTFMVGDQIKTAEKSEITLIFPGGSEARLSENTRVEIRQLEEQRETLGAEIFISQDYGEVYHRVIVEDELLHSIYQVETPQMVVTADGTAFVTIVGDELDYSIARSIQHSIEVKLGDESYDITEGEEITAFEEKDPEIMDINKTYLTSEWVQENKRIDQENGYETGILADTTPPDLILFAPNQNPEVVDTPLYTIFGSTEVGAMLTINGEKVVVGADGGFSWEISLVEGENKFSILSKDTYRNKALVQTIITYQVQDSESQPVENDKEKPSSQESVSTISLSSLQDGKIVWDVDGYSDLGFKVLWSKTSDPMSPTKSIGHDYLSDPEARSYTIDAIDAIDGSGTYNVRVCEYLGGSCGVYSNLVQVEL